MTSILTNTAAMAAASALAATQRSLARTQQQVSSGLRVESAQDGAAIWSIATAMRSRIDTIHAVNEGLSLTSSVIGVTTAALDVVRKEVEDIKHLILSAVSAGTDKRMIQAEIALKQKDIVSVAEAASFNGVNWLVTRVTGVDTFREDIVNGGPRSAYTPSPPPGQYVDSLTIVETQTISQTLGSSSSGVSQHIGTTTYTPNATHTDSVVSNSDARTTSGDPYGYQNAYLLFSPDGSTMVNLHPIELFKSFRGTKQSSAYESFSDVPSFEYGADPDPVTTKFDPYLTFSMDDALDTPIDTPDQSAVLSTVLNLDVTRTLPEDLHHLASGVDHALSTIISGQSFLGGLANRVLGQQIYNTALVDALTSGVGSLVDADMNEASTRLAALQAQQQLGLQALSIANDNATMVLKLFGAG